VGLEPTTTRSSEAHFSPCEELVVSSAHLEDGMTLTDEGLLLGKMAFGSLSTSGQDDGFGSRAASVAWGSSCSAGLTETLMLLELCEFCCAGAAHLSGAGLQYRRHGRLCFGAEGLEEHEAPRVGNNSARGRRRPGRDVPEGTTRPR
jgi:hypothetical protein